MSQAIDCIVCGTCVADVLVRPVPLERAVGGGQLFHVDPIEVTTGGIVCNTGVALRRLGAVVETAAVVGDDLWAGEISRRPPRRASVSPGLSHGWQPQRARPRC